MFSSILCSARRKYIPIPVLVTSSNILPLISRDQSRSYHDGSSSTGNKNQACNFLFPFAAFALAVATNYTKYDSNRMHCDPKKLNYSSEMYQHYYDGIFLPYRGTELMRWRECQCELDKEKCKALSTAYKSIGDVRGTFVQIPTYKPLISPTKGLIKKKHKIKRWMKKRKR